jgi:hypothetical protein
MPSVVGLWISSSILDECLLLFHHTFCLAMPSALLLRLVWDPTSVQLSEANGRYSRRQHSDAS